MTSTPRILTLFALGTLALGLSSCAGATPVASPSVSASTSDQVDAGAPCAEGEGVTVVVDSSALADGSTRTWCFVTDSPLTVANALKAAGVEIEGTEQYGDQVICRVDGLPSASEPVGSTEDPAYVESCKTMPAAFAYWALWQRPAGGAWDYAQEGLSTLTAGPGESIELLFTLDGAPAAPAA